MKRKIFTLTFALLASLSLWATGGSCGANVTWDLTDNTLTITGSGRMYDYATGSAPWYAYHSSIRTVSIGYGITHIGAGSFYNFLDLVNVNIAGSPIASTLVSIGSFAFDNCPDLNSMDIPSSVKFIGGFAFDHCPNFTTLRCYQTTFPPVIVGNPFSNSSNISLYAPNKWVFTYGQWQDISFGSRNNFPVTASGNCGENITWTLNTFGLLTISGTGAIPDYSDPYVTTTAPWYEYKVNISAVLIEDGITTIGSCAFAGLTQMTAVSIPNTVTQINYGAFQNSALLSVTIPASVTLLYNYVFSGCTNLRQVTILSPTLNSSENHTSMFSGCTNLKTVKCHAINPPYIGQGVTSWFYNVPNTAIIYVLQGSIQAYNDFIIQTRYREDKDDPWEYTDHYVYQDAFAEIRPLTKTVTIGATGWATFSTDVPLDLENMTASTGTAGAYYAYNAAGSTVNLRSTTDIVPAGEGLMLKGSNGATITIPVATSGTSIEGNKLVGSPTGEIIKFTTPNYVSFYLLANNGGTAQFENISSYVYSNSFLFIPEERAYLDLSGASMAPNALGIDLGENNATQLEALAENENVVKFFQNGQLYILRDGITYDTMGRIVR